MKSVTDMNGVSRITLILRFTYSYTQNAETVAKCEAYRHFVYSKSELAVP
jgi:hypothetical protein